MKTNKLTNKKLRQALEQGEVVTNSEGTDITFEDEQVYLLVSFHHSDYTKLCYSQLYINENEKQLTEAQQKTALRYLISLYEENQSELRNEDTQDLYEYNGVSPHDFINLNY